MSSTSPLLIIQFPFQIKSPHLESFLKRSSAQQHPNELKILNLLWRYYEKTKNYSAAARVLSKLSEKERYEKHQHVKFPSKPTMASISTPRLRNSPLQRLGSPLLVYDVMN